MNKLSVLLIIVSFLFSMNTNGQLLLKRHLTDRIDKNLVISNRIKTVDYGDYYEKFDEKGNHLYEKSAEWPYGRRYENKYDENGKLISRLSFDENETKKVRTENYVYDEKGRLTEIETKDTLADFYTRFKYNSKDQVVSINSPQAYEMYKYGDNGKIIKYKSSLKGEYLANSSHFSWEAEYDEKGNIVREIQIHDKKYRVSWIYTYDDKGRPIECRKDKKEARKSIFVIKFEYNDQDLVISRSYFDINGMMLYKQKINYEFY